MMLGVFWSVLLLVVLVSVKCGGGADVVGVNIVSFKTLKATASSPAVCAATNEDATSLNDQTVDQCANRFLRLLEHCYKLLKSYSHVYIVNIHCGP